MTAVTAPLNAEASADRELPLLPLIGEGITVGSGPVQVTIHVDVVGVMQDCKTLAAFEQAMQIITDSVVAMTQALPE